MSAALGDRISCSVEDASRMTGIGRTLLYDLVGKGEIKAGYLGRKLLVDIDSLRAYVKALPTERAS